MVENVEEFETNLKNEPLGYIRVFRYGEIDIPKSGTKNRVSAQISEPKRRLRKCRDIDVSVCRIPRKNRIHSRNDIGPLVEVGGCIEERAHAVAARVAGRDDPDWPAALRRDDRVELPAARDFFG